MSQQPKKADKIEWREDGWDRFVDAVKAAARTKPMAEKASAKRPSGKKRGRPPKPAAPKPS